MLVQEELQKSLATARQYVDAWLAEPAATPLIDSAIVELHQVNGILRVVEFRGAVELSATLLHCCQTAAAGGLESGDTARVAVAAAFIGLERYIDSSINTRQLNPLLITETNNRLRALLRQPSLLEVELLNFQPGRVPELAGAEEYSLADEELSRAKRLLHMYEVGLLAVLRDNNVLSNMGLMERAVNRLRQNFVSLANEEWWLLVGAVLQQLRSGSLRLSTARKRMLALVDGFLRQRLKSGAMQPAELLPLHRDALLCLLLLAGGDSPLRSGICRQYALAAPPFDDAGLAELEASLGESSVEALNSVAQALGEQLQGLKELLESNRDAMTVALATTAANRLQAIGETLGNAGFLRLKGVLLDKAFTFNQSMAAGIIEKDAMQSLAEALLLVENTLRNPDCFNDRAMSGEQQGSGMLAREMLDEATGVVINESKSAISLAKRGISAYLDSGFDAAHVSNVGASLTMVQGAFQILGHERAATVLRNCINYIDHFGVREASDQTRQAVETLADALISLEYYLDELSVSERENRDLLTIAEESVSELGFAA
jgi:hypothetical protein